jgi:hypothetical protein
MVYNNRYSPKHTTIYGVVLGLVVVCALLGSCISPFRGEEGLGTIVIGIPGARAVVTDTEAGTLSYTVTLTGPGGVITRTISTMDLSVKVIPGAWTVEVKAYGRKNGGASGPDTFLRAVNDPKGTKTVTINAGGTQRALIKMVSATEVTTWAELKQIAELSIPSGTPADRAEIIFLKGTVNHPFALGDTIAVSRNITIIAEGSWEITRGSTVTDIFFDVFTAAGNLTLEGGGLILDGGSDPINPSGSLVKVTGGSFTLDGPTLKNNYALLNGGGVAVTAGNFIMKSGIISGNYATSALGGGVSLGGGSSFTMSGGTISGNHAPIGSGGGVQIDGNASFTMSGGTISGNVVQDVGGGVNIYGLASFTMSGGTISGNTAATNGSGVYVASAASPGDEGIFTMQGAAQVNANNAVCLDLSLATDPTIGVIGTLSSSAAATVEFAGSDPAVGTSVLSGSGTDIAVNAGKFTLVDGGHINSASGNYAVANYAAGDAVLFIGDSTTPVDANGGAPYTLADALDWLATVLPTPNAVANTSYTIVLKADATSAGITFNTAAIPPNGVTLTLKGTTSERTITTTSTTNSLFTIAHTNFTLILEDKVKLQGVSSNTVALVTVSAGALKMKTGSKITGNTNSTGWGGGVTFDGSTFAMEGGEISDNTAYYGGGGVWVSGGTFEMSGGAISGNTASDTTSGHGGGGVYVNSGSFTMSGGTIGGTGLNKNTANKDGGGVYVSTGGFTMTGGTIIGNESTSATGYGGGVYFTGGGSLTMSGGTIGGAGTGDGNSAASGGGVYFTGSGSFTMSGSTTAITGNTATETATGNGGGGVYVSTGTFTMEGGEIGGNQAASNYGGGVYVDSNTSAFFTMKGGTVYGSLGANSNTATNGASLYKDLQGYAAWGSGTQGYVGATAGSSGGDIITSAPGGVSGTAGNTNDTLTASTP